MPVKIKRIVNYKQNNPTASLADIGNKFKVSKQYIHKVLKKQNIPTSIRVQKKHVSYCLVCGIASSRKICKGKCHFQYYNIKVNCAFCRIPFYRKRAKIVQNYERGYNKIYCSRKCYYRGQRDGLS